MATLFVDKIDPQSGTSLEIGSSGDTISKGSGVVSRLGVFESQLLHIQDQKSSGTSGGTITSGDWRTRDINTVVTNEITGASLSSNQITLPTGTYYIQTSAPAYNSNNHKIKLKNTTDSSDTIVGTSEYDYTGAVTQTRSFLSGRFTIAAQKVFEIQHRVNNTSSGNGGGIASGYSVTEVFTDIQIWRTA